MRNIQKIRIYYAHAMSGLSHAQSAKRARDFKRMLGSKYYNVRIPEDWQKDVTFETIFTRDIKELSSCSICVFDHKYIGESIGGTIILGRGGYEELGYAKALGRCTIEINETNTTHPFSVGSSKVVGSLKEAVKFIKESRK